MISHPAMTKQLYDCALARGRRGQLWRALARRPRHLLALAEIDAACTPSNDRRAGTRTVPIRQIRGSQGRSRDFDPDFNPIQDHTKERWLSIARALEGGKSLPPVKLAQVGDVYFVQDGHHRISVARTLGQQDIEAEVTHWQMKGAKTMLYLDNKTARELYADRLREAKDHRLVMELRARAARGKQSTNWVQYLVGWLRGVVKPERVATEETGYMLPLA
jgi:hypothetical protein